MCISYLLKIATVEIAYEGHEHSSTSAPLLIMYSIVTCLLFGVHLLALMISRCVLSQLDAHALFNTSEHNQLDVFIDVAWILSTGIGKRLFLLNGGIIDIPSL